MRSLYKRPRRPRETDEFTYEEFKREYDEYQNKLQEREHGEDFHTQRRILNERIGEICVKYWPKLNFEASTAYRTVLKNLGDGMYVGENLYKTLYSMDIETLENYILDLLWSSGYLNVSPAINPEA